MYPKMLDQTGGIRLWKVALDGRVDECLLDGDDRVRAARIRTVPARQRWLAGRAALRVILGRCAARDPGSLRFSYGEQGKPSVASGPPFSVAHASSRGCHVLLVAVAPEASAVGVDLEPADREMGAPGELAGIAFTNAEEEELERFPAPGYRLAALRLWTAKEAVVKALGNGVEALPAIEVSIRPHPRVVSSGGWTLVHPDVGEDWIAAVATRAT